MRLAVWPHVSDIGEPDLTIVTVGDLPARTVEEGVRELRGQAAARIRVVNVADLTVLGDPSVRPRGFHDTEFAHYLGASAPILIVALGHPAAVWGLLQGRLGGRQVALRELAAIAPVVTLSNVTCVDADIDLLAVQLAPYVADHFPSCRTGYAKPYANAFYVIAKRYGTEPGAGDPHRKRLDLRRPGRAQRGCPGGVDSPRSARSGGDCTDSRRPGGR